MAATLALVLLGVVSLGRLPVSLLPDVTLPVLTIRTDYPGAAAPEVSRFVAEPIEAAIAPTPGLVELRSVSRNGQVTTTARWSARPIRLSDMFGGRTLRHRDQAQSNSRSPA
ncbi:MAG: efflux RND transporter permease subunit [Candidatus Methylomirabilaceae bacterium]